LLSREKQDFLKSLADVDGRIDPEAVIDAARNPACVLHKDFEWDVSRAAQKHWVHRACELIRFVKLEVRISKQTIVSPYYVVDPEREKKTTTYLELTRASHDRELAEQVLRAELDRIAQCVQRAQKIALVLGMAADLKRLLKDVTALQTKAQRVQAARAAKAKGKKRGRGDDRPAATA
jgi:hypothetical protein